MAMSGYLEQPLFAVSVPFEILTILVCAYRSINKITFQRDTIDIGGSEGTFTIGKLPEGVDESSITWVPVRLYHHEDGGQYPPSFAPHEVYPL